MGQGYRALYGLAKMVATLTVGPEFRRRYSVEVHQHPEHLSGLRALARKGPITLIFSAHGEVHNDTVALRNFLLRRETNRKAETTHR